MCAEITVKHTRQDLLAALEAIGIPVEAAEGVEGQQAHVLGYNKTDQVLAMVLEDGIYKFKEMNFSLCPHWAKEFPYRGSTYNARLVDESDPSLKIFNKPAWRGPFAHKHCLIPVTEAFEWCTFGENPGYLVKFAVPGQPVYFTYGIYDEWVSKSTGEIQTGFAMLTHIPYKFFKDAGHDRSIIVPKLDAAKEWLEAKKYSPKDWLDYVIQNRATLDWTAERVRPYKTEAWRKKAPTPLEILEMEEF